MTHMAMEVDQCLKHNEKNNNKYSRLKTVYDNITINLHCCYSTLYLSFKTSNSLRLDFIYILTKKKNNAPLTHGTKSKNPKNW